MGKFHGDPTWYELSTSGGQLDAAGAFYGKVLGWQTADSGMPDFTYHLASVDGTSVAGLTEVSPELTDVPPHWAIYFAVDDIEQSVPDVVGAGGQVYVPPTAVPGTGRFAVLADPQGAAFGLLQPDLSQMTPDQIAKLEAGEGTAFNQKKAGHGQWHELMTTDPEAGLAFYSGLLGWQKSHAMDLGEAGVYQLFSHNGSDIGGVMGLGNAPVPCWLPYFGANGIDEAITRINDAGGVVVHGPQEIPGGAFIAIAQDPQGAHFAIVGPKTMAG